MVLWGVTIQRVLTYWSGLQEQFPQHVLCHLLVQPSHVHGGICASREGTHTHASASHHCIHLDSSPEWVLLTSSFTVAATSNGATSQ